MPFTLGHPALVWPLARRPLVPAALIAGSLAPDLLFYLPDLPDGVPLQSLTHTPTGMCSVDVVLAVGLVATAHLLRWPALALLPDGVRGRLAGPARHGFMPVPGAAPGERRRPWRLARIGAWWVLSAVIGAFTHIIWDGFTHSHGGAVKLAPWLATTFVGPLPVFQALQWLSSAVGLLVVAGWLTVWIRSLPVVEVPDRLWLTPLFRMIVAGVLALACAAGVSLRVAPLAPAGLGALVAPGLFGAGAATGLALVLYGLAWHVADRVRAARPEQVPPGSRRWMRGAGTSD